MPYVELSVKVIPNARANRVTVTGPGAIKVHITAPPVDGKANRELISYLADWFGVSKSKVIIRKGETGRKKVVHIHDLPTVPEYLR